MVADEASLRRQLTAILAKTATASNLPSGGWWVGDVAAERQNLDDLRAGRTAWLAAHNSAERGLEALDSGAPEMAAMSLTNALWLYIDVLEKRVRPSDMRMLGRPAGRRARPSKKTGAHLKK